MGRSDKVRIMFRLLRIRMTWISYYLYKLSSTERTIRISTSPGMKFEASDNQIEFLSIFIFIVILTDLKAMLSTVLL